MRHLSTFALLAAATAFTSPSFAADLPQGVPVAQLVKQVSIPYSTFTLKNGLKVVVHARRSVASAQRRDRRCSDPRRGHA